MLNLQDKHARTRKTQGLMAISSPVVFLDLYILQCATLSPGHVDSAELDEAFSDRAKYGDRTGYPQHQGQSFLQIDLSQFMEPVVATLGLQNSSQEIVAINTPTTLSTNSPPVNTRRVIRQEVTQNAVVLNVKENWESEGYLLAHLPRLHTGEDTFVSLLQFDENDKWLKLIWNKGPQDSYSATDTPSLHLPSIISTEKRKFEGEGDADQQKIYSTRTSPGYRLTSYTSM